MPANPPSNPLRSLASFAVKQSRRLTLQQILCDRLKLHVARPLVDRPDLGIAVELLDRIFPGEPVASEKINARGGNPLSRLRREELCHRRLLQKRLPRILQARRVVDQEPRRLELRCHARELEL